MDANESWIGKKKKLYLWDIIPVNGRKNWVKPHKFIGGGTMNGIIGKYFCR